MSKINVKDIAFIAIFSAIILVLEYALHFLPNVQLTVLLLVLFSKKLGLLRTSIITLIYVLLDTFLGGGFSIYYFPSMLIGWLIIPVTLNTIFKRVENPIYLALLGIMYSFIYCWLFAIPSILITNVYLIDYLAADLLFEIILAVSSFLSILWLYKPLGRFLDKLYKRD